MLKYAKALVAGIVTFCGTLGASLSDGHVSGVEWCTIVPATVVAVAAVFGVSNAASSVAPADKGEGGALNLPAALVILGCIALVLWILALVGHPARVG